MLKRNPEECPIRVRPGLVSHILLQTGDTPNNSLAVTRVEVAPAAHQQAHSHAPEQIYVILEGIGRMNVGCEVTVARPGELIYIPPNAVHSIENMGNGKLIYLSVSVPAFDLEALYDNGQLRVEA
ncbi:MAG: cupin domain-containing protein [Thermodesulfobacteriota bacterium]